MAHTDVELIRRILQGNQDAFSPLVKKYQKGVHTLAWRKIGDFHIAQEITQDAFLTAYKKLGTLKNHTQFPGWLYVIAANLCRDWLKKSRLPMESLDADNTNEVDKVSYSRYVAEKQESDADETRREVVKKLLKKLPESERTVMMMHYLGEMTIKSISEFLGVSQNTIKSRLSRARNRLRQEEDVLQENLGSFQLPDNLTENIMQEVSRISPIPPSAVNKPVAPLAVSAASAVLIFLLMGVGTQYLSRFQKPYSFSATSEPTVEIIDAVFVLDSPAKPAVRSQPGSSVTPGKGPGSGQQSDETLFATLPVDNARVATPKPQWTQTKGPVGGSVQSLFVTANGNLYAGAGTDLYTLTNDGNAWRSITPNLSIQGSWQITEHGDTLYIVSDTELLASADKGETWNPLGTRPEGQLIDLIITDGTQANIIIMYLALADGVFQSIDAGKSWTPLNDGINDRKIRAITAIENTLFVGTDAGLYRHRSDGWEQLPVGESENIRALESTEHQLYVAVGPEVTAQEISATASMNMTIRATLSLYRSTDLGDSWQALDFIVGTEPSQEIGFDFTIAGQVSDSGTVPISDTEIIAAEENILVLNGGKSYYSNDSGKTWVNLGSNISDIDYISAMTNILTSDIGYSPTTNILYKSGPFGIHRTTDAGKTWHPFNTGLVKTGVMDLVATPNKLYANLGQTLAVSPDDGESWTSVSGDTLNLTAVLEFNDTLYIRGVKEMPPQLFQLSDEDNRLIPVPGMPILEGKDSNESMSEEMKEDLLAAVHEEIEKDLLATGQNEDQENIEVDEKLSLEDVMNSEDMDVDSVREVYSQVVEKSIVKLLGRFFESFAVSDTAYYMESEQKLFRWKPGTTQWFDTGLVNDGEFTQVFDDANDLTDFRLKLAVLGKIIYAGKSNGHLFQSFDEGDTWNDVTTSLPFSVTSFNAIAFAGSTLYIATDRGVAFSNDGISWQATTDAEGVPIVIERFAVDGTTVYGTHQQRVYQLKANANTWQQITPEIPVRVNSLAVDGNTLYVGTAGRGVLRFTLDESE